jgi:hypothetical protein
VLTGDGLPAGLRARAVRRRARTPPHNPVFFSGRGCRRAAAFPRRDYEYS